MEKLTFSQIIQKFLEHNKQNNIETPDEDKEPLYAVIVFDNSSFDREYPLESRSYRFRSDNKGFITGMISNSIWGTSLDETDHIRIDWYIGVWKTEYCYIEEREVK